MSGAWRVGHIGRVVSGAERVPVAPHALFPGTGDRVGVRVVGPRGRPQRCADHKESRSSTVRVTVAVSAATTQPVVWARTARAPDRPTALAAIGPRTPSGSASTRRMIAVAPAAASAPMPRTIRRIMGRVIRAATTAAAAASTSARAPGAAWPPVAETALLPSTASSAVPVAQVRPTVATTTSTRTPVTTSVRPRLIRRSPSWPRRSPPHAVRRLLSRRTRGARWWDRSRRRCPPRPARGPDRP